MATFYLLPPRAVLGDHLLAGIGDLLPGLELNAAARRRLTEAFLDALDLHRDVYLVFREDLPFGVSPEQALRDGFGAEPGDEVVEVYGRSPVRRWRVGILGHFANG